MSSPAEGAEMKLLPAKATAHCSYPCCSSSSLF